MLTDDIQDALKSGNAVVGTREALKFIKANQAKVIVMANNVPENVRSEIEHVAKFGSSKFETFDGNSRDFGTFCGKPFPVSVLAIKG